MVARLLLWPYRLLVRIAGLHPAEQGSIPCRAALSGVLGTDEPPKLVLRGSIPRPGACQGRLDI